MYQDRYALKDQTGKSIEQNIEQTFRRVAEAIGDDPYEVEAFYQLMLQNRFLPGGRILAGAGTGNEVTYYNCFVIEQPEDSRGGILDNIKYLTEIMARGGGVGVNLSSLRPKGAYIKSVNGHSSGPVNWGELYSDITGKVIQQGGSRRGALMIMLDDDHPDIEDFIRAKDIDKRTGKPIALEYANVSVAVSDVFMQAVKDDDDWQTQFPTRANGNHGTPGRVYKARYLWNLICERAHATAEPGVVFMDRCQNEANTGYYEKIRCVNPCGEQPIGEFAVCNLGAMNLSAYVMNGEFSYTELDRDVKTAVRLLDNVIDKNFYFLDEFKSQLNTRRIGLGTMGLADMFIKLGVRYGSEESINLIESIYSVIRDAAYEASTNLALEKGPFGFYDAEEYLNRPFIQRLPERIQTRIRDFGIRNAVLLTQAPTGTTSMMAGVSSGIEPVFAFLTQRTDRTGTHLIPHPLVEEYRAAHNDEQLPAHFVATRDLTPEDHIRVQAAIQRYTDASISKTVNGPASYTVGDVERLYMQAYDLGCKGVTFYREGSRDAVLVDASVPVVDNVPVSVIRVPTDELVGKTYKREAPEGKVHVTINSDNEGPIEVFVNVGRAGSDVAAMAEGFGRLMSAYLQLDSLSSPQERLENISRQLVGLGGSGSTGFGPNKTRSIPDAVAKVLAKHLTMDTKIVSEETSVAPTLQGNLSIHAGDLCPECGGYSLVHEEGCTHCVSCSYSRC